MKFHTFLTIFLSLIMIASSGFAETAPAPTAEEVEAALKEIPPATDEQKKAMQEAIETMSIDTFRSLITASNLDELRGKNDDSMFRKSFEELAKAHEQILTGKMKDQLPKFFISEVQRLHAQLLDFSKTAKNIENFADSPELEAFKAAKEKENIIFDAYLTRELGKTFDNIFLETNLEIHTIYKRIKPRIDQLPMLQTLQMGIDRATTDQEKQNFLKAKVYESWRLAIEEFTRKKE